jgi:hypothetical protein
MRLSSLSIAAVLLFSSIVVAQHHEAGSAPSSPAPSAAPSAAASSSPSSPPNISTGAPSTVVSHSSAPSSQAPASVQENRVAPSSGPTVSHGSISPPPESRSGPTATSPTHEPTSDPGRLTSDRKISGEAKIVSAPRVGQNLLEKEPEIKPGPPELRRRMCENGPCKEKETEWKADPPRTDLRRRICPTGPCPCPSGQTAGKGGCIAHPPVAQPFDQCQPGERWSGVSCAASAAECSSIDGRAAMLVSELRGLKAQIQHVCGQNPAAQDCEDLKQRQSEGLQRYRMLLAEAGPTCQGTMMDIGSLE